MCGHDDNVGKQTIVGHSHGHGGTTTIVLALSFTRDLPAINCRKFCMSLEIWDFVARDIWRNSGRFLCVDRVMIVLMIESIFGALEAQSPFWTPKWSV